MTADAFLELDQLWAAHPPTRIHVIGSGALMLQSDFRRGTKDSDVFETTHLTKEAAALLRSLAGRTSDFFTRRRHYIDIVGNGVPFLPVFPIWNPIIELNARLRHLEILALDVVDVVVAKIKPLRASDSDDIDEMITRGLVRHARLVERFRSAVDAFAHDARADDLPRIVENFHQIERDMLGVPETEIELPSWV